MNEWDLNILYMKHILEHIGITDYTPIYIPIAHRGCVDPVERVIAEYETIDKIARSW